MSSIQGQNFSDSSLLRQLEAARGGGSSELGTLLEIYRPYLLELAKSELSSELGIKVSHSDLVQQSLHEAATSFSEFRGGSEEELRKWLTQILIRNGVDVHRAFRETQKRDLAREVRLQELKSGNPLGQIPAETNTSPSVQAYRNERAQRIDKAIRQLPELEQQVVRLRNLQGATIKEAAQILGIPEGEVKSHWARAIVTLSRVLQTYEHDSI